MITPTNVKINNCKILRGNSIINIYNKLIFSPLLGIFYPLSDYDPQTLSALDNLTLAEMDFELV